jgi:hypothetical protein
MNGHVDPAGAENLQGAQAVERRQVVIGQMTSYAPESSLAMNAFGIDLVPGELDTAAARPAPAARRRPRRFEQQDAQVALGLRNRPAIGRACGDRGGAERMS